MQLGLKRQDGTLQNSRTGWYRARWGTAVREKALAKTDKDAGRIERDRTERYRTGGQAGIELDGERQRQRNH
jgi:hypothetical protein